MRVVMGSPHLELSARLACLSAPLARFCSQIAPDDGGAQCSVAFNSSDVEMSSGYLMVRVREGRLTLHEIPNS